MVDWLNTSFGSVTTPSTSCTRHNILTHWILDSFSSLTIYLTSLIYVCSLLNSISCLWFCVKIMSSSILISFARYLSMSRCWDLAISVIVSYSDFKIVHSFFWNANSAASLIISSSISSRAVLKLFGNNFDDC